MLAMDAITGEMERTRTRTANGYLCELGDYAGERKREKHYDRRQRATGQTI